MWLTRAKDLATEEKTAQNCLAQQANKRRRQTGAQKKVPDRFLMRRRMQQGPPYKCPVIRETLWDWFVDVRASIATTISPKCVLMKAREIATTVLHEMRRTGQWAKLPNLDAQWRLRWKRDYAVVFRRPNRRYKISKAVLLRRLRSMWLNMIRIRRLAYKLLGKDLADQIYGIDEKPLHFNESGSKNVGTLEILPCRLTRTLVSHDHRHFK